MSNTIVGILGLLTIVAIVVTLFQSKTQPAIAFIVWPTILALILVVTGRYSFDNIAAMIKSGFGSTGPTAALFVFSVLYFGIMTDAGMFDVIIGKLMTFVGDNVIGVCIVTCIIALVGRPHAYAQNFPASYCSPCNGRSEPDALGRPHNACRFRSRY